MFSEGKFLKIPVRNLKNISYIYITIPLLIFLACWLKPFFAVISISSLLIILYKLFKENKTEEYIEINKTNLKIISIICFLWCIVAGIGGFYFQNMPDWHIKNAILYDITNFNWPVIYDNGVALVYYIGIMLPAALFGKLFHVLGAGEFVSMYAANLMLLLWSFIGVILSVLHVCLITKAKKYKTIIVLIIMIFFSGMDIIIDVTKLVGIPSHIEWHGAMQYSSNMTLLSFAFNQSIIPWIITCLFLQEPKKIINYGTLGAFALFYAPLPFIGICFYFVANAIMKFFSEKNFHNFIKEVFDIKNILSCLVLLPILFFYYKSNYTAANHPIEFYIPRLYVIPFICAEALAFILIIWHRYYKDINFYIMTIYLVLCPFFVIQGCNDFCMRVSVPSLFILMIFCIKFLFYDTSKEKSFYRYMKIYIIIFLLVGSITPILEFKRGIYYTYISKENTALIKNGVISLNNKINEQAEWVDCVGDYKNYGSMEPEKTIFWKYIARKYK